MLKVTVRVPVQFAQQTWDAVGSTYAYDKEMEYGLDTATITFKVDDPNHAISDSMVRLVGGTMDVEPA